jgi:2-polyprenyl-3-methyl-5-hydroxy-6-metoxy-1,4-benzoquinol methylase
VKGIHNIDHNYSYASKSLKKVLRTNKILNRDTCADTPCGNGRNIFLLANNFKNVLGIDVSSALLNTIAEMRKEYLISGELKLMVHDLLTSIPNSISQCDFICNIHFYDLTFLRQLKAKMKKDAILFIETPSCSGDNFKELPKSCDLAELNDGMKVLEIEKVECKRNFASQKSFALKLLLQKI